jgi:hypothetical protein
MTRFAGGYTGVLAPLNAPINAPPPVFAGLASDVAGVAPSVSHTGDSGDVSDPFGLFGRAPFVAPVAAVVPATMPRSQPPDYDFATMPTVAHQDVYHDAIQDAWSSDSNVSEPEPDDRYLAMMGKG